MANPAPAILGEARHGIGVADRAIQFKFQDLCSQDFAHSLVGIERENPVMRSTFGGEVFLRRVAAPRLFDHPGAQRPRHLARAVPGSTVHHYNLVGAMQAFDGPDNIPFFVQRDDGGAQLHLHLRQCFFTYDSASATSFCCSSACRLEEPAAGLALEVLPA